MSGFFILGFFMIVVGIPVIGSIVMKIHQRNMDFKEKQLAALNQDTAERTTQYSAHTKQLEQRVRVLERIVTDKGYDVSQQIEDLRDDTKTKELS